MYIHLVLLQTLLYKMEVKEKEVMTYDIVLISNFKSKK